MDGYFPENDVDHINRIRDDNRWDNLREVSRTCNMRNKSKQRNNKSGVTGVHWNKYSDKWRIRFVVNKKQVRIGEFNSFNDAVKSRWKAEIDYNFPNCNITSSAYLYLKENNLI